VNTAGGNLHPVNTPNNLAGNTLTPEPYFIHTAGNYFNEKIHAGRAELVGDSYTYSASYDMGEGWSSVDIPNNGSRTWNATGLFPYTGAGAPIPMLKVNAAGNAVNARYFKVTINTTDSIAAVDVNYYDYIRAQIPLKISHIAGGNVYVELMNRSTGVDRLVFNQVELSYARIFNFGGASSFPFELPANPSGNYLEIANFGGAGTPVLIDITKNAQLQQDILVRDNTSNAVKNFETYRKSLQQLQTQRESYELAKRLLDLVLMKFEARVATIVDVKNAQESFANAGYLLVNMSFAAKARD